MPNQPPHQVSSQEFQNPHPPRSIGTQLRKTNPIPPGQLPKANSRFYETNPIPAPPPSSRPWAPNYAKQTQSHKANSQKMRNEPNLPLGRAQMRKTNPISPPRASITRNEPNFDPQPPGPQPKYAKQTQFTHPRAYCLVPRLRETNPISATADLWRPKNTKRTQLPYRWRLAGIPIAHYAKQTQS